MGPRPGVDVVPRPHDQRVAHDQPSGVRLPRGLEDEAAGQVPPGSGHAHAVRAEPEMARAAIQDGTEDAGESGRGTHSHSTDPAELIRHVVSQSERKP